MEDIHYSNDSLDTNRKSVDTSVDELQPAQETKMEVDPPARSVEDGETVLKLPRTIVEVVIEKKVVELEPEDPILPDHYYDNGNIPVFKPVLSRTLSTPADIFFQTMDQFANFEKFITRINQYGMQAGIVKVIPPPEWYNPLHKLLPPSNIY